MKRVRLVVAYDGTNYHGWQVQPNGITIESVLNSCLSKLLGEEIHIIGASRTDSGVHALCNIAVFDTETRIPGEKISYALNQRLPDDIRIRKSEEIDLNWHPRYCDSIKTYRYKIWCSEFPMPTVRLYSHFTYYHLRVDLMQEACQYLIGKHDFKSFCSRRTQTETTIRTITNLHITQQDEMITIEISGTGFLYNMVRIIVGTLLKVGISVYPPEHVKEILEAKDRMKAGPVAPANGLTLFSYEFL
ncbi:MAG: tRNA pseudouridine(38-40) synthase TruA [Lachnospiraceae bacterium]|nr:tRNA pseudouridine(38-40) synthase TruA [Lachnospiraceae bacterium]